MFSDIPEIALAQARRLLPEAAPDDGDDLVEILWAKPASPGQYFPLRWFCVKVWKVEKHSAGPRAWLRVQWADGALSGMSFTDIVAIRQPTNQVLSPWQTTTAKAQPIPTIADYRRHFEQDDDEE